MADILVVGAGITGSVYARYYASTGKKVCVIDKREHIGGNCYDYIDSGIHVHKYGPHIFHTNEERVWKYLSQFTEWFVYTHRVQAFVDGMLVPVPFNLNSIYVCFSPGLAARLEEKLLENYPYGTVITIQELYKNEDEDVKFLADYIYEKIYKNYTVKQWGVQPEALEPSVFLRVPVRISRDDRYFSCKYQGIPKRGYTQLFANMLEHKNIHLTLNKKFHPSMKETFEKIIYTGPIDEYYDHIYGALPYRSVHFSLEKLSMTEYQLSTVVNYPNNYDFTRITEYNHFFNEKNKETIIGKEYPENYNSQINEPLYPIIQDSNMRLYDKYKQLAGQDKNILFAGRLGNYKYYDMDKAVEAVLNACGL